MIEGGAIEFFHSIPDSVLLEITLHDWDSLKLLCMGYTLDLQLAIENKKPSRVFS